MKILELLDRPEKWTKEAFARNSSGEGVDSDSTAAVSWCLEGAMRRCGLWSSETSHKLMNACQSLYGTTNYEEWQDRPETTFEQVWALVVLADV